MLAAERDGLRRTKKNLTFSIPSCWVYAPANIILGGGAFSNIFPFISMHVFFCKHRSRILCLYFMIRCTAALAPHMLQVSIGLWNVGNVWMIFTHPPITINLTFRLSWRCNCDIIKHGLVAAVLADVHLTFARLPRKQYLLASFLTNPLPAVFHTALCLVCP